MGNHVLNLDEKKLLTVTEVTDVEGFDEETMLINLKEEGLIINGRNLHIEALDLEEGRLIARGEIESMTYTKKKAKKSILERFRK